MAHKLILAVAFFFVVALAFARAFGQENAPYHMSTCPAPAICCAVPAPQMTEPVPGGTPTVVTESFVALYGAHVSNENTPIATPTTTPTFSPFPTGEPTPTPTPTVAPSPTPTPAPIPGADGNRYLQFFDTVTEPAAGSTPIGSSSWFIGAAQDRDVHVGDKRGWAFNQGIMACCSITQSTFTASDGCGFLLEYYR